jgi:hypothetical protein
VLGAALVGGFVVVVDGSGVVVVVEAGNNGFEGRTLGRFWGGISGFV